MLFNKCAIDSAAVINDLYISKFIFWLQILMNVMRIYMIVLCELSVRTFLDPTGVTVSRDTTGKITSAMVGTQYLGQIIQSLYEEEVINSFTYRISIFC